MTTIHERRSSSPSRRLVSAGISDELPENRKIDVRTRRGFKLFAATMVNGRLGGFSGDRLMRSLAAPGQDVEIVVLTYVQAATSTLVPA